MRFASISSSHFLIPGSRSSSVEDGPQCFLHFGMLSMLSCSAPCLVFSRLSSIFPFVNTEEPLLFLFIKHLCDLLCVNFRRVDASLIKRHVIHHSLAVNGLFEQAAALLANLSIDDKSLSESKLSLSIFFRISLSISFKSEALSWRRFS